MDRKIKLIWDFRGPDSLQVANHFVRHLKESPLYSPQRTGGVESVSEVHCIAYMIIQESEMPRLREALRPHRATYAD